MNIENNNTIFRFKFSTEFNTHLLSFAKIHQYDDRQTYKDSWAQWIVSNDSLIENETRVLKANGYQGNILDKMFKSGRYYFRTKTHNEPKQRRKYISIDTEIIDLMDNHILQNADSSLICKPSISYEMFCLNNTHNIKEETKRLIELNLHTDDITSKLKKTYKNRYFLYTQERMCMCRNDYDRRIDIIDHRIDTDL